MALQVILDDDGVRIRLDGELVAESSDREDLEEELINLVEEDLAEPETPVRLIEDGEARTVRLVKLLGPAGRRRIGWAIADSAPIG